MLGETDHDQARQDAINLSALPAFQVDDIPIPAAQQRDDDLLAEGDAPNLTNR